MVEEVWLHIGTPKSGTSSLQKYLVSARDDLSENGLAYVAPKGKDSANDLAIASNRNRDDLPAICEHINREIEQRTEQIALISSEMLYGFSPSRLKNLLPSLSGRKLKILVYLRRQDKYIESMYLQKSKNGRFSGTIQSYITKFEGSGSNFREMLRHWEDDGAMLIPRVLEPGRLFGGTLISDAMAQIGIASPPPYQAEELNVSPGVARVQLLQIAAAAKIENPRKLQRTLAALYPQEPHLRGSIFSPAERRAYLDRFEKGNEVLRQRYFPDYDRLFDESDIDLHDSDSVIPSFEPSQLEEIFRLLCALKTLK